MLQMHAPVSTALTVDDEVFWTFIAKGVTGSVFLYATNACSHLYHFHSIGQTESKFRVSYIYIIQIQDYTHRL